MPTETRLSLFDSLVADLEKADRVIGVLMAHLNCGFHMPADARLKRVADDLDMRGLGDHEKTRHELLQEMPQW